MGMIKTCVCERLSAACLGNLGKLRNKKSYNFDVKNRKESETGTLFEG